MIDIKDRMTVLACSNAAGTYKLKLLMIGKCRKPRCLKNVHVLPVEYKGNKKAWITQEIFKEWLEQSFIPQVRSHCAEKGLPSNSKVLLVVDNCGAPPPSTVLERDNFKVRFLPPNCTAVIQPLDQGLLQFLI